MKKIKRKEAFLGSLILGAGSTILNTVSSLINNKRNAKAQAEQQAADLAFAKEQAELTRQAEREQFNLQQKALEEQRRLEQEAADRQWQQAQTQANQQAALQQAQAKTIEMQNQDYADIMKSRVTAKCGGKFKNRNNNIKKKKANLGLMDAYKNTSSLYKAADWTSGGVQALGSVGNLITSLVSKPAPVVKQEAIKPQVFKPTVLAPVEHKQVVQGETYQAAKKKVIKQSNPNNQLANIQNATMPLAKLGKKVKYKSINSFK